MYSILFILYSILLYSILFILYSILFLSDSVSLASVQNQSTLLFHHSLYIRQSTMSSSSSVFVLCCRCHDQVTIYGDVRFKCAKINCAMCGGYVHKECLQQTKCRPINIPMGFKVSGCLCGRAFSCYYDCLERWFRIIQ